VIEKVGQIFKGLPFSSEQLLSKQLKLSGESAKIIMTTFAFPYVSYLLYDITDTFLPNNFLPPLTV